MEALRGVYGKSCLPAQNDNLVTLQFLPLLAAKKPGAVFLPRW